jgi:MtN3 and saliva related transmembrane protein
MEVLDFLGWAGSILLAFCGLPQAIESWKTKSADGVTWGLLVMWGLGEVLTFVYVLPRMDIPLLFNYSTNMTFLGVIIYYKMFGNTKSI